MYRNDQWFLHSDMLIQIHVRPKKGYEKGCARQFNTIQAIPCKQAAWKTRWSLVVCIRACRCLWNWSCGSFTSRHFIYSIYSGVPYVGMGLHQGIFIEITQCSQCPFDTWPAQSTEDRCFQLGSPGQRWDGFRCDEFEGWFEDREVLAIQGLNFSLTHVNETQTGRR